MSWENLTQARQTAENLLRNINITACTYPTRRVVDHSRYVDDQLYCQRTKWESTLTSLAPYRAPFDTEFELILNLAVGGTLPGRRVDDSIFPATMLVDYVRWERDKEAAAAVAASVMWERERGGGPAGGAAHSA